MSGKGKSKLNQSSKSTSSKKRRNKRDIISTPPYSEFPATTSTFSGLVVLILIAVFSVFFGVSNTFAADSSITISLSGAVNLNLLGGNSDGAFGKSTSATANVETNNYTGYTFTIIGGNATGALVGENSSSHTIPSIDTPLTEAAFDTSAHNNEWGFLPSHLYNFSTGTSLNAKYQPSPTNISSTTIDVTKSANAGDPNEYTLALAARVDDQTANDYYSSTFTLAATGNATEYHIAYVDANNNMPGISYGTSTSGTAQISGVTPTKDGYEFAGWCTVSVVIGQDCAASGGTVIPVSGNYSLDSSSANNVNLYAIWEPIYYMQNIADWKNTLLPNIGNETIAVDKRDGKKYYVAKLLDGNIWMTQNLDFNIGSATINSSNTDVPANWSDSLTSTYSTGTTTWNNSDTAPESYDPSDRCWNGTVSTTSATIDTGTTACSSLTTTPNHYHIGNYYNWTAAVAMADSSSYTKDNTDVNQSICPAGWMLPKNTGSGSFYNLVNNRYTAGTNGNIHLAPPYFVYGGLWGGSSYYLSSDGHYWSSVVNNSYSSYILYFDARGSLYPQRDVNRLTGYSVRCIARP